MTKLRFTRDHEYVRLEGEIAIVGISDHAQSQLGDVVFVELPQVGTRVQAGDPAGVVESVKAASDVYAPIAGEIIEVNGALEKQPGLVNEDAQGAGWFIKIRPVNPEHLAGLMDEAAYQEFLKSEA